MCATCTWLTLRCDCLLCCSVSDTEIQKVGSKDDIDKKMVAFDPNIIGKNESFRYTKVRGVCCHGDGLQRMLVEC